MDDPQKQHSEYAKWREKQTESLTTAIYSPMKRMITKITNDKEGTERLNNVEEALKIALTFMCDMAFSRGVTYATAMLKENNKT